MEGNQKLINPKILFIGVFLFLIFLVMVFTSFLTPKNEKNKTQASPTPNKSFFDGNSSSNNSPVSDKNSNKNENTGWKTYRNNKIGFQFKYPTEAGIAGEGPVEIGKEKGDDNILSDVLIKGKGLDLYMSLSASSSSSVSQENIFEPAKINGHDWMIAYTKEENLIYKSIFNNNEVSFLFKKTNNERVLPTQIITTFKFSQ